MQDFAILVGHNILFIALVASGWSLVSALVAQGTGRAPLQTSAARSLWVATGGTLTAAICLWIGFLTDDFRLDYVYHYSSSSQALSYKIGALWGGQAGSLLLWALILAGAGSLMLATNRDKNRALMPVATAVVAGTLTFFLGLLVFIEPPFATSAMRPDGVGLNPQLKNYWMMIHPPTLYFGYVTFTIPFAFAIAALVTRRTGDLWFRTTRRWTVSAWFFLGTGILLGSYWAYIELGWGGYWAWDPVENASLMPWLTGTAFLHSVMIQEKKGMLKIWNMLLIILTFSLSIFGTFLTRSGIISSVHAFATSDIGTPFAAFLALVFFGSLFLLILRLGSLKSEAQLESVISRESSFLFNNMILVGIAATVLLLTAFPLLSEAVTDRKVTMGPPIFNLVNVPWALGLLLLMGIGPLIAWRKATRDNLRRNFIGPALWGVVGTVLFVALAELRALSAGAGTPPHLAAVGGMLRALTRLDVRTLLDQLKELYPAITIGLSAFVVGTVVLEFWRGARVRVRRQNESWPLAAARLMARNKRRYGGYVVHVGIVLIFIGVAMSSAYQLEVTRELQPGQLLEVDDYWMRYDGFEVEAVDDHLGAVTHVTLFDRHTGRELGRIHAAQRLHPNMQVPELKSGFILAKRLGAEGAAEYREAVLSLYRQIPQLEQAYSREVKTPSTEVGIHKSLSPLAGTRFAEDFYVVPMAVHPLTGQANFRVFVNPLVNLLWLGGLVFVLGALICIAPDSRERKRIEAALALEDKAVA